MGDTVKILFLGDFLLSDQYLELSNFSTNWSPFTDTKLRELVLSHDAVAGSLDCTLGHAEERILGDRIILKTGFSALLTLKYLNMKVMTVATNHAFDFGQGGFKATQVTLSELDIQSVGAGQTLSEANIPLIINIRGTKIAWLAAATPDTSAVLSTEKSPGVNPLTDLIALEKQVKDLRKTCDVVIFLPHWGNEWYWLPSPLQRNMAQRLIKAGVDLIIGNHPHVSQEYEFIGGKPIFYALGNAVAPEIKDTGAGPLKQLPPNRRSLAVSVQMTSSGSFLQVKIYDLFYGENHQLTVQGERLPSHRRWLFEFVSYREQFYTQLWTLYCVFMELFFIPIRYRLIGYGFKYALKRVNITSILRRFRSLLNRSRLEQSHK